MEHPAYVRRSAPALLGGLLLALSACGQGGPESCSRDGDTGCLIVVQRFEGKNLYEEGSISYARVSKPGGDVVFDSQLEGFGTVRIFRAGLEPGRYRMTSYQRPCEGNCGSLDPPTDECSVEFEIKPEAQATIDVRVSPGEGCTAGASF